MFYVEDKFIEYPNKSTLADVMRRNGEVTDSEVVTFTPFAGCAWIVKKQFGDTTNINVDRMIDEYRKDYSVEKARPTEDMGTRDMYAVEVMDYTTRFEDVPQESIDKYVEEVCIGFKLNRNGKRTEDYEKAEVSSICNIENGESTELSDVIVKTRGYSTSELLEARIKLPYLLKQLHEGSKKYGGSLLSFAIAMEKVLTRVEEKRGRVKPSVIVANGPLYKMSGTGEMRGNFCIENNNAETFRKLIRWVKGELIDDPYYNAYTELNNVLVVLELSLSEEDAKNYTNEYINKIVCTYVCSNEEYVKDYGFVDKRVLALLGEKSLFEIVKEVREPEEREVPKTKNVVAANISESVAKLGKDGSWKVDKRTVAAFLSEYNKVYEIESNKKLSDWDVEAFTLQGSDGHCAIFDAAKLGKEHGAIATLAGYLVAVELSDEEISVLRMEDAIAYYRGGDSCAKKWERVRL